jgi:hypothetical protein
MALLLLFVTAEDFRTHEADRDSSGKWSREGRESSYFTLSFFEPAD